MRKRLMQSESRTGTTRSKRPAAILANVVVISLAVALAAAGCRFARETAKLPSQMVKAVVPGAAPTQADPAMIQSQLLRYADDFSGRTSMGIDEYARRANTEQAQSDALTWKLALNSSVLGIATGANPIANLVDMLALSSLTRAFLEQNARSVAPAGALDPWLDDSRLLETNAWRLTEGILTPAQQGEIRDALGAWLKQQPSTGTGFFRRPGELSSIIRQSPGKETAPGSVFSLVGLDPTAGLDPAVREITRTRLFAERALYAMERMPFLVRWQTELFAVQLLHQDQVTNALAKVEDISRAVESATQATTNLADRFTAERKAILSAFDEKEGKLRDLSSDVGRTLAAGERMSTSLNTTLTTFDALMKRFGVGEPSTTPPDTNSPPFNILDYARTAQQIAVMAQQLNVLITNATGTVDAPALDKRIAEVAAISSQAKHDAKSVLNHLFIVAGGLVLLIFCCSLVYRRVGMPRSPQKTGGST